MYRNVIPTGESRKASEVDEPAVFSGPGELQVSPLRRTIKLSCSGRNDNPFLWLYVDTT
ncbi:hypothetical protein [Silvibacterium dinghuense]|uniref:hypothetical protein n=1 Tax=Silvibacterium dinghuense TaxID=1560006 RepID=UPI0013E96BEA|nr:hypothetical protein [Silvibacterium dinghuense]